MVLDYPPDLTLVLRGVPPSLNEFLGRENARRYRREKRQWTEAVQWTAMACKDKPRGPWASAIVQITYWFPNANRHDADNYSGKFLLDGLTKAKIIEDDDLKHITTVIHGGVDRENPRTVIEVYGLGANWKREET